MLVAVFAWAIVGSAGRPTSGQTSSRPTSAPVSRPGMVAFQPGVRINWTDREVEVDATVILRQGPIELFACSPRTREHESIVCIQARPLHVYQALGLIGLTPGHPVRFDPATNAVQAATGDPVDVRVRYLLEGRPHTDPIERWMRARSPATQKDPTGSPLEQLPWVFAGSFPVEGGAIAADAEGTVVAVVDFSSALIALPELHSASNAELWLEPDPRQIPAIGTACTLLVKAGPLRFELDAAGRVQQQGLTITRAEAARRLREFAPAASGRRVRIVIQSGCPRYSEQEFLQLVSSLGIPDAAVELVRLAEASETGRAEPRCTSAPAQPAD